MFAYNSWNFVEDGFKERMFKKSANLDWFPIDVDSRKVVPINIHINDVVTDDGLLFNEERNQTYPVYKKEAPFTYYLSKTMFNGLMI